MKTKRLTIKPFETEEEIYEFVRLYNMMDERSLLDHDEPADIKQKLTRFREHQYQSNEKSNYMILDETNRFIGTIGFSKISSIDYSIGYRLFKHQYRGHGYMSETLQVFINHMFSTLPELNRITLHINAKNIGSKKVALKNNFTKEGVIREAYILRGEIVDFEIYGLLKREYLQK